MLSAARAAALSVHRSASLAQSQMHVEPEFQRSCAMSVYIDPSTALLGSSVTNIDFKSNQGWRHFATAGGGRQRQSIWRKSDSPEDDALVQSHRDYQNQLGALCRATWSSRIERGPNIYQIINGANYMCINSLLAQSY